MGTTLSERNPASITVLDKLTAGPLTLKGTRLQHGWARGFERRAKQLLIHPHYPRVVRWFLIGLLVTFSPSTQNHGDEPVLLNVRQLPESLSQ